MTNFFVDSARTDDTGNGLTWAAAKKNMTAALALVTTPASDIIWVKNGYSNSYAVLTTWTLPATPGLRIFVTSDLSASPASSLSSGALEATSGGNDFNINGFGYIRGFTLQAGSTSSVASLTLGNSAAAHGLTLEDCVLYCGSTNSGGAVVLGCNSNTANISINLINVALRVSSILQVIRHRCARLYGRGLSLHASSAVLPVFLTQGPQVGDVLIEASDLSGKEFTNLVAISTFPAKIAFRDCLLPSTFNYDNTVSGAISGPGANEVSVSNCSNGNQTYKFMEATYEGVVRDEHTVVRLGGATPDGTTAQSMKMISTNPGPLRAKPLRTPEQFIEVLNTGSKTLSVEFAHTGPTDLLDTDISLYAMVMDQSGNPKGTIYTTRPADLAAPGSLAYDLGDLWESSVSFGGVMELTFTVNQPGFIVWWVGLHKPGYTVYVDQKAAVTGETTPTRNRLIPGHGFTAIAPTTGGGGGGGGGSIFGGSVIV